MSDKDKLIELLDRMTYGGNGIVFLSTKGRARLTEIKGIVEQRIKFDLEIVELNKELNDRNNRVKYLEQSILPCDDLVKKIMAIVFTAEMHTWEPEIRKLLQATP